MNIAEIEAREQAATTGILLPILLYPGYKADAFGHIWSVDTNWRGCGVRQLREELTREGYLTVRPTHWGTRRRRRVHRLVALAFLGPPPSLPQEVRHLNGNPVDNRPMNLAWGSRQDNADDRERHGRTARGSANGQSRLTEGVVRQVRRMLELGYRQYQIAGIYGVDQRTVSRIKTGETWSHVT